MHSCFVNSEYIIVTNFREGLAYCLEDEPQDHYFPIDTEMLPGVMYNGDDQCRLLYRTDARQCDMGIVSQPRKWKKNNSHVYGIKMSWSISPMTDHGIINHEAPNY